MLQDFHKDSRRFQELTGIPLPLDSLVSLAARKPKIDILLLDDKLHQKYGVYERIPTDTYDPKTQITYQEGTSMRDFLTSSFGEEASGLVKKYL